MKANLAAVQNVQRAVQPLRKMAWAGRKQRFFAHVQHLAGNVACLPNPADAGGIAAFRAAMVGTEMAISQVTLGAAQ